MAHHGRASRPGQHRPRPTGPGGRDTVSPSRLRAMVQPVLDQAGYDLEELTVSRAGRRHLVRVVVDGDDVSLDDVAVLSRAISAALDAAEESGGMLTPGEYTLEVSSPGIDRPLTLPRHWRRNVGRRVQVKAGDRLVTGRVLAADDGGVALEVDGERLAVGYADLGPGRVQVDLSRSAPAREPADETDDEIDDEIEDEIEEGEDEE